MSGANKKYPWDGTSAHYMEMTTPAYSAIVHDRVTPAAEAHACPGYADLFSLGAMMYQTLCTEVLPNADHRLKLNELPTTTARLQQLLDSDSCTKAAPTADKAAKVAHEALLSITPLLLRVWVARVGATAFTARLRPPSPRAVLRLLEAFANSVQDKSLGAHSRRIGIEVHGHKVHKAGKRMSFEEARHAGTLSDEEREVVELLLAAAEWDNELPEDVAERDGKGDYPNECGPPNDLAESVAITGERPASTAAKKPSKDSLATETWL